MVSLLPFDKLRVIMVSLLPFDKLRVIMVSLSPFDKLRVIVEAPRSTANSTGPFHLLPAGRYSG